MDPAASLPPGDPTLIFAIACAAAMPTVLTVARITELERPQRQKKGMQGWRWWGSDWEVRWIC
jgi:hypothetical protein